MPMSVTLRFQSTGAIPGRGEPVVMRGGSLTLGRGEENDVVLPDPDRTLSKRHCVIEDQGHGIYVVDISTNGTFLNYGKLPIGQTPTPLSGGDVLILGAYEILVEIAQASSGPAIPEPMSDAPVSHGNAGASDVDDLLDAPGPGGDFLDDLLSGRDGPVGPSGVNRGESEDDWILPPLGEEESLSPEQEDHLSGASEGQHSRAVSDHFATRSTAPSSNAIPDDWDDDFFAPSPSEKSHDNPGGSDTAGGAAAFIPDDFGEDAPHKSETERHVPSPPKTAPPSAEPTAEETTAQPPVQSPPPPVRTAPALDDSAVHGFLDALGVEEGTVRRGDLPVTMRNLGKVLRIMVEGMREILMTRTAIKSEFRIEQTMIKARGNNPLKFSISPEQAIEAMVQPSAKGYLEATAAAEEALKDIKAHEVAMLTGMEAALKGVLERLDPKALEGRIVTGGGLGSMLKSKKARYWEIYEEMYAEISDQAENDFNELFAREFARAYKEQLDKLE